MNATTIRLHGVTLRLESQISAFIEYANVALEPYRVEDAGEVDVVSRLEWVDGPPAGSLPEAFAGATWQHRPDRDLYLGERCGYWLRIDDFTDLHLAIRFDDGHLELTGRYYFSLARSPRWDRFQRWRYRKSLPTLRGRRFSTLLYYLFYHPVLWHLSRLEGLHVLHAGAVATRGGAVVLAGMPGCGKSTLSVAMLGDPACRMLSDNLVLHDGARVWACPELLLLDERSRRLAGAGAQRLVATGERRVFARDAHRLADVELQPQPVAALFHVERAVASAVRELDAAESCARLHTANVMAKEVRRIAIMNEVLDTVAGTRRPDEAEALRRLAGAAGNYEVRVADEADLAQLARREILGRVTGAPARGSR
ncbi:MAG: hypothetical protein HY899_18855 [Deltaproteobacteria bacterium]|nr:hypothetical protein [Deltaproteobacteria bacterium]